MKTNRCIRATLSVAAFFGAAYFGAQVVVSGSIGAFIMTLVGSGVFVAMSLISGNGGGDSGDIPDEILKKIRQWHGKKDLQFDNFSHLVKLIVAHQPMWVIASTILKNLVDTRNELQDLMALCHSADASSNDRMRRNTMLENAVNFCLKDMKLWAYGLYHDGIISIDDLHQLGFLLPGEKGGKRAKSAPTKALAVVKASVVGTDSAHITVDQSDDKNAGQVVSGWPDGVKYVLIVILAEDGETEVIRYTSTTLHNDFKMPADSHGKMFIVKAAFLKHINDEPNFSNRATFTMPKVVEDAIKNNQK